MAEIEGGTFVDELQFRDDELSISTYGRMADGSGKPWTEGHRLRFADQAEFRAFLRDLERYGRKRGFLPARKATKRAAKKA